MCQPSGPLLRPNHLDRLGWCKGHRSTSTELESFPSTVSRLEREMMLSSSVWHDCEMAYLPRFPQPLSEIHSPIHRTRPRKVWDGDYWEIIPRTCTSEHFSVMRYQCRSPSSGASVAAPRSSVRSMDPGERMMAFFGSARFLSEYRLRALETGLLCERLVLMQWRPARQRRVECVHDFQNRERGSDNLEIGFVWGGLLCGSNIATESNLQHLYMIHEKEYARCSYDFLCQSKGHLVHLYVSSLLEKHSPLRGIAECCMICEKTLSWNVVYDNNKTAKDMMERGLFPWN